jgi:hypothetical protein
LCWEFVRKRERENERDEDDDMKEREISLSLLLVTESLPQSARGEKKGKMPCTLQACRLGWNKQRTERKGQKRAGVVEER